MLCIAKVCNKFDFAYNYKKKKKYIYIFGSWFLDAY